LGGSSFFMATSNDKFKRLARKWVGSIGAGGVADGTVTTIPLSSSSGLPTDTAVVATIDRVDANGIATPSLEESVVGVVSGDNLVTCTRGAEGTAQAHSAGAVVEILFTNKVWGDLIDGILAEHSQAGAHTTDTISEKTADAGVTVDSLKIKDGRIAGWDGWSELTTLTRVSDTTATLSGDWTDRLQKGDKLWWKSNGVSRYNYIIGVTYSSPNTTITITGGYVSAANDSRFESGQTITEPRYSKAANPQGFPAYFNYTPTWSSDGGAFTNNPTVTYARFKIKEGYCQVEAHAVYPATPGGSGRTIMSLPLTPAQTWTTGQGLKTYTGFYTLAVGAYNTGHLYFEKYDGTTCIEANGEFAVGVTYAF